MSQELQAMNPPSRFRPLPAGHTHVEPSPAIGADPGFLEAGVGPTVICIHGSAASSGQWQRLIAAASDRYRMLAPDAYDVGRSPRWPSRTVIRLADEAELVERLIRRSTAPVVLVGHSYGAAVALIVALRNPGQVSALALYEPTLFSFAGDDADGISRTVDAAGRAIDDGDPERAAMLFIDYWSGPGTWRAIPAARRPAIASAMVNVRRWGHALFHEPTPLSAFRAIEIPVLYMLGTESPLSALGVARRLMPALPNLAGKEFQGLGHMGPVTHPGLVNPAILAYLDRVVPRCGSAD